MGYDTVALNYDYVGKLPSAIENQIPNPLPCSVPRSLRVLRRCTIQLTDSGQNHRLSHFAASYDIVALRPTTEPTLQQACQASDADLVSLDLSQRFSFPFKHKTFSAAFQRGVRFEICYAPGIENNDGGLSRRNLISNATQIIRATRGRGIIISSQAKNAFCCRAPADVVNLATLWGLSQERGREAVTKESRFVLVQAEMKRRSFRGVIEVISGGEVPSGTSKAQGKHNPDPPNRKRKAENQSPGDSKPAVESPTISKRERKRQAKKARLQEIETGKGEEAVTHV